MQVISKYIRDAVYITILIVILFLAKDYFKDKIITTLGGYTDKEVKVKIDSTYKVGKLDTIAVFNHYVKTKGINLNPKARVIYIDKPNNRKQKIKDSLKQFEVKIKDSLLDGTFTINNRFNGDLENSFFNYKPKFPKYITRVDTVFKTKIITETLINKRSKVSFGAGYDLSNQNIQLLGGYTFKNDLQVLYEYETPLNNDLINGILPKQKSHSVKLIYNF